MKYLSALLLFVLFSCEQPKQFNEATVSQIDGVYVFIYSKPQVEYDLVGTVVNDLSQQMKDATSKKKNFLQNLAGIASTTTNNINLQSKISLMIVNAKEQFGGQPFDGLIFESGLDEAKVIMLKKL